MKQYSKERLEEAKAALHGRDKATFSRLQLKMHISFYEAQELMATLEEEGFVRKEEDGYYYIVKKEEVCTDPECGLQSSTTSATTP